MTNYGGRANPPTADASTKTATNRLPRHPCGDRCWRAFRPENFSERNPASSRMGPDSLSSHGLILLFRQCKLSSDREFPADKRSAALGLPPSDAQGVVA